MIDSYTKKTGEEFNVLLTADGLTIKKNLWRRFLSWLEKIEKTPTPKELHMETKELAEKIWAGIYRDSGRDHLLRIGVTWGQIHKMTDDALIQYGKAIARMPKPEIKFCPTCDHEL